MPVVRVAPVPLRPSLGGVSAKLLIGEVVHPRLIPINCPHLSCRHNLSHRRLLEIHSLLTSVSERWRILFSRICSQHKKAPFFETTIRHLGGLLSAYALSKNPIALEKAEDLGTRLSPVFNTTSGLALFDVNTVTYVSMSSGLAMY